jgi:hypothetical protein
MMIVAVWNPNIPAALLLLAMIIAMYAIPSLIVGIRTYNRSRDLARRITQEHEARHFLDHEWARSAGVINERV